MQARQQDALTSVGLLILRLGVGGYMATHGWGKVDMVLNRRWDQFPDPIGLGQAPGLIMAAGAEFVCAILVAIGLLTRFAAAPVVFTMAVAAFVIHRADPWMAGEAARLFQAGQAQSWASKEPALLFLIPFLTLVFTGAGRYSLDALIFGRKSRSTPEPSGT